MTPPNEMPDELPVELDERGSLCPAPVIALGRALTARPAGDFRIVLLADDPAARFDVPAWCRMKSATLLSQTELADGSGVRFEIWV